jgi:16S rRNA (cytosine967-C5)-methyltransferase
LSVTPAARAQAAIEVLDEIIAAARDGGPAADTLIARYFKIRRYAGSKDRRAVRDLVYRAVRRTGERPASGRAALVGLAADAPEVLALFDGSPRGPAAIAPDEPMASQDAVPAWLVPLLSPLIDQAERAALLERAPLDVRVNRLKADPAAVAAMLDDAPPVPGLPDALRLPEGTPIETGTAWQNGLVEVQDAGSQWIVRACGARPGMTVIDLCAGAGGKTLALAAAMEGQGRLIAADTILSRLNRLPPRAERAGAGFIEKLLLDQGREAASLAALHGMADIVLVDAPCSGTGTWRRNPEARWRLTPARLDRLVAEQARILDLAAPLVAPGGTLAYAVCSLLDGEGRAQVEAFLSRHVEWSAEPIPCTAGREQGPGRMLTPQHDATDGFFMAHMRKA